MRDRSAGSTHYLGEISVKKMLLLVTGFALVSAGMCTYLFAQGTPAPQAQPGTKVAVINIGHVFNKYVRAIAFKKELEDTIAPFKANFKKYQDQGAEWEKQARDPSRTPKEREAAENNVRQIKRTLEDLTVDMQKTLGKRQEDNLVTLWKEVNLGISKVSEAYGFQIVFGYGDPLDKGLMDLFPNINRKMQNMDAGGAVPLYVHGSVDLSHAVTETLNRWAQPADQKGVVPTSGNRP
jgi:Skp family chaperone for outer membrane proteins